MLGYQLPGWLGCHVIAKLIFVAFNGTEISAKRASPANVIRPYLTDFFKASRTHTPKILTAPLPHPQQAKKNIFISLFYIK